MTFHRDYLDQRIFGMRQIDFACQLRVPESKRGVLSYSSRGKADQKVSTEDWALFAIEFVVVVKPVKQLELVASTASGKKQAERDFLLADWVCPS